MIDEEQTGVSRDRALTAMTKQNVGVGVHYLSIAEHPYYQRTFGWRPEDYPHACKVGRETLSIPLGANLTDQDVGDVIAAVRRACTSR
jgi:dTDP-4-amino-4,6-dideoxygalactose transaminase